MKDIYSYKDFAITDPLIFKDIDGKKGIVTGYFADFDSLDSDGDVIRKGAFARTIELTGPKSIKPRIKHLMNHDVSQPLGVILVLKEDDKGLYYESKIGNHSLGVDFIKMVDSGLITEHSIGYRTLKAKEITPRHEWKEGDTARELTELKLYEGSSLTFLGANPNTPLTGSKAEIEVNKLLNKAEAIEKFCRESTATDETIETLLLYNKQLLQSITDLQSTQSVFTVVPETVEVEKEVEQEKIIVQTKKQKTMAVEEKNENKTTHALILDLKESLREELKTANHEQLSELVLQVEVLNSKLNNTADKKDLVDLPVLKRDITEINNALKANQPIIDQFIADEQKRKAEKKDFGTTWAETIARELDTKQAEIKDFQTNRTGKIVMEMKVGPMMIANVTGEVQASYNQRQGLVPNQKVNMRDLIPTTPSPTGLFVTYRETATSGGIGIQTEGQLKPNIDYSFTEIKTVSKYIAGVVDFTKQLMFALPWLQTTLPRMLLRDFYKKENDYIYTAMQTAAAGNNTTSGANTPENVLQLIANQRTADFNTSYLLTDWLTWANLLATKGSVEYGIPGGVTIDNVGNVRLAGLPLIGASFADPGELLIWDNEEVERVETETLRVEFSYENEDNFKKNKVTAKVECFEELNVLRPDAIISTTTS